MPLDTHQLAWLLLVSGIVAVVAKLARVPYTVGLVGTGAALAFSPFAPEVPFTRDFVFSVLLPPLVFEAALFLKWEELRRDLAVVITLASIGVGLGAAAVAAGMHVLAGWPLLPAAIFGSLVAATDPVSVIATFKHARVGGRLRLLVEAESLFNDGTAAVLFTILVSVALGASLSPLEVVWRISLTVGGGLACGALVAFGILYLAGKTTDHLIEISFTTVAAYGSFLLAEELRWSGVLATLTAGLIVGNRGPLGAISPKGREAVDAFWEYAAFVSNSIIFLLIGAYEARQEFGSLPKAIAVAIVLSLVGRAAAIYPTSLIFARSRARIALEHQHMLVWGGLRGALSLALAVGLPSNLEHRGEIVAVTFAVVAFSIVVQGLTVTPLLRRLGNGETVTGPAPGHPGASS
jgi:CPA1 family monovalent cation:H+ antiporter